MDKICLVWVDDIVIWGKTPEIISKRLLAILDRLLERGLLAAAHKAVYFRKEIKCFFFFFFLILRRMGKNKALPHHTSTYFHTRRVSI